MKKIMAAFVMVIVLGGMTACGANKQTVPGTSDVTDTADMEAVKEVNETANSDETETKKLEVCFGYDRAPFTMNMMNNETAEKIAYYVGSTDWNLPIVQFEGYENDDVMQFYDIPDSYDIPSNPEKFTSEKAGEVYYSNPNRIVLFYQDAEVTGEYTKIGEIEYSEDFYNAVVDNPVLEGWNTKIVSVKKMN